MLSKKNIITFLKNRGFTEKPTNDTDGMFEICVREPTYITKDMTYILDQFKPIFKVYSEYNTCFVLYLALTEYIHSISDAHIQKISSELICYISNTGTMKFLTDISNNTKFFVRTKNNTCFATWHHSKGKQHPVIIPHRPMKKKELIYKVAKVLIRAGSYYKYTRIYGAIRKGGTIFIPEHHTFGIQQAENVMCFIDVTNNMQVKEWWAGLGGYINTQEMIEREERFEYLQHTNGPNSILYCV